ncbi:MAG: ABC transporter ATP-binding protein, partial [Actinomycetota bacterium]
VGRPLPAEGAFLVSLPLAEIMLAIVGLAVASMAIGLLISAFANSSDKTMPPLVVAVLVQVVLSGGVFPLNGKTGLAQLSWLTPARWGFGATAATLDLTRIGPATLTAKPDPLWQHSPHTWLRDMALVGLLTLVVIGLSWLRLSRLSGHRRR